MINYDFFEKIKYKNYQIDNNSNIRLLNTFNELINILSNSNLKYMITGSFGISLLNKKIYRTWKDIDILFADRLNLYLKLFPVGQWYYKDFNKNKLRLYNIKNNNYIEFLKDRDKIYEKKMYTEINNSIKIVNIKNIITWKKFIGKTHKHIDDIFFLKNQN